MLLKFESLLIENKVLDTFQYVLLEEGIMSVINDFALKSCQNFFLFLMRMRLRGQYSIQYYDMEKCTRANAKNGCHFS